jgi:putative transposase
MHVHLVFVTKYRSNVFDDAMLRRCEDIMIEVCDGFGAELREFNGQTILIQDTIGFRDNTPN